jgi:hypothetical protein
VAALAELLRRHVAERRGLHWVPPSSRSRPKIPHFPDAATAPSCTRSTRAHSRSLVTERAAQGRATRFVPRAAERAGWFVPPAR